MEKININQLIWPNTVLSFTVYEGTFYNEFVFYNAIKNMNLSIFYKRYDFNNK